MAMTTSGGLEAAVLGSQARSAICERLLTARVCTAGKSPKLTARNGALREASGCGVPPAPNASMPASMAATATASTTTTMISIFTPRFIGSALAKVFSGHAVTFEDVAHRVHELSFGHRPLRLRLLLQMLVAALFQLGKLGADDQILDGDFTLSLFIGPLDDNAG